MAEATYGRAVGMSGTTSLAASSADASASRGRRLLRRAVAAAIVLPALYFAVTFVHVWQTSRADGARPAQAVIVLGAAQYDGRPSAVLRARLDHAAALYHRKIAPLVVVTGGKAEGDRFTESAASANYLHTKGVPDEVILREATGRTSWQSLAASARFLIRDRGIRDVVLVSDPFHAARIRGIASELGFRAATSPTRRSPIKGLSEFRHMVTETAQVGVARVIGFRRLVRLEQRFAVSEREALGLPSAIL
ncbi:MAG TPA: YdcF family protein [Acidimicrobiia bacterium]|nr:YdcF family protein [Acidimicrobiia bacterium]